MVGRHVAVGARAAVSTEAMQPPVEEGFEAAHDSVTGLVAACTLPDAFRKQTTDV